MRSRFESWWAHPVGTSLDMVPTRVERLRVRRASRAEARWTEGVLDRQCRRLGARVRSAPDDTFSLAWV